MSINPRTKKKKKKEEINNFYSFKGFIYISFRILVFGNYSFSVYFCWRAQVAKYVIYCNGFVWRLF